jgi:hypothetical protein
MTIQVAIPADQFEYLSAKAVVLQKSLPDLVKNLLTYGRLTPSDSTPDSRASSFLPKGVKRLAKTAAK